jgi:hypothetical protein
VEAWRRARSCFYARVAAVTNVAAISTKTPCEGQVRARSPARLLKSPYRSLEGSERAARLLTRRTFRHLSRCLAVVTPERCAGRVALIGRAKSANVSHGVYLVRLLFFAGFGRKVRPRCKWGRVVSADAFRDRQG